VTDPASLSRHRRTSTVALVLALVVVASTVSLVALVPAPVGHAPGATVRSTAAATSPSVVPSSSAGRVGPATRSAAGASPDSSTWNSNFFNDVQVTFAGTGLPGPFQLVPYTNQLPTSDLGFWLNISALDPLSFANVTIWGTQWPLANGVANPITGFNPSAPSLTPMQIHSSDPEVASYYFDNYRFFWPGSTVYFNITVVNEHGTPSTVKSSTNDSVPVTYPGGFTNLATWAFQVDTPWSSENFTDDIAIRTTPNVLGTPAYSPNADQTLSVSLTAIDLGGTVAPIPDASLDFTVIQAGSAATYSESFGPIDHSAMTLSRALGPYPGSIVEFNVTAWLPWEGGAVDEISSPVYSVTWSPNGGWWYPTQGLLANLELAASPDVLTGGVLAGSASAVPSDAPVNVSIHEPVQNVTISSAVVDFAFNDGGLSHDGSIPMTAMGQNTSYADLYGLPPGGSVTFYVVAKDIHGNPISSGNFSYVEAGPTAPPLPAGRGLVFLEVLDLTDGSLVPGFTYTIANATWSENGSARAFGFASPTLPGTSLGYQLGFGVYDVSVDVFGVVHYATISVSASSPTPTVLFYAESTPAVIPTTSSVEVVSLAAALGLAGAAVATVPLMSWLEERREKQKQEERRITL
jgi:hypothetical protein